MTTTLSPSQIGTIFDPDPRAVTTYPVAALDDAGQDCPLCDTLGCMVEGQMYFTSLFSEQAEILSGSLRCLADIYRSEADYERKTTIEVQR